MRTLVRRLLLTLAVVALIAVVLTLWVGADIADRRMNHVTTIGPYAAPPAAVTLLDSIDVVDLHADALLWPRDLLERHDHGHVDVPRLHEGHVALQVFSVVTKTPRGINYERNTAQTDNIRLLAIAEHYPIRAWSSLLERAREQARRLADAAARSPRTGGSTLRVIRSRADLAQLLEERREGKAVIGGVLATEGLHPIEGKLENVDSLVAAGFRIFGLTHFFDNEVGGSAHGVEKGGLTPLGRRVIAHLDSLGMVVDLAHASPRLVDDVLSLTRRPVIVSHSGVRGTCPGPRNLTDDQLRRIAATGGLVGIGYWDGAVCEPTLGAFAKAVRYAVGVAGVEHVALGSDFDGSTTTPIDASGMAAVADALQREGLADAEIAQVMGGNALRFLLGALPER